MKKTLIISAIAIVLAACGETASEAVSSENETLKVEIAELTAANLEYEEGIGLFEGDIESYRKALAEIEANISAIDTKHGMVINLKGDVESDEKVEDDILAHIEHIHATMLNSKHKIAHLHNSLNEASKNGAIHQDSIQVLDQAFYDLATAVYVQDKVIKGMAVMLDYESEELNDLTQKYEDQEMYSEVLYTIIHTKFYIVGTKKELLEKGIITQEGGFVVFGRTQQLNANADDGLFTLIDVEKEYIIKFDAKEAKLLTTHPEENYVFLGDQDNAITGIEINDFKKFWDKADFLVIEIKK